MTVLNDRVETSRAVLVSVVLMVVGSVIAAAFGRDCVRRNKLSTSSSFSSDLAFDMLGYAFIFVCNFAAVSAAISTKKKLDAKVRNGAVSL